MSAQKGGNEKALAERARDTLLRLVVEPEPAVLEEVFASDPEMARRLFLAMPNIWKSQLTLTRVLSGYAMGLPAGERAELLRGAVAFDPDLLASAVNSFSVMAMAVHRENPELASELFASIDRVMSEIDFGKFREAVTALLDYWTDVTVRVLGASLDNPVIIANLFGMIAPLLNSLVEVLEGLLEKLELPPEILASAVFNVLGALDAGRLGRVLTEVSGAVNDLHRGNLILGGDEPRFRAVLSDFMKRLLDELDLEAAAGAAVALGEDLEVAGSVMTELFARDPESVSRLTGMLVALGNSAGRILSAAAGEIAGWPDEVLKDIGAIAEREADLTELGRAIDSCVALELRMREANPGLHGKLVTDLLTQVSTERLELVLRGVVNDVRSAAMANPGIRIASGPEEVARRLNEMLASFNSAGRAAGIREYVSRLLGAIDKQELDAAVRSVLGPAVRGILSGVFGFIKRIFVKGSR